jgi:hypothetical protein
MVGLAGVLPLAIAVALGACAAEDDHSRGHDGSGGDLGTSGSYWCECNTSDVAFGVDEMPDPMCESSCAAYGGVKGYVPRVSLAGTPECNAFCARVDALGCGECNREFFCEVGPHSCVLAALAQLDCEAETGTFSCDADGSGWQQSSSCGQFEGLCAPDGGAPDGGNPDGG